MGIFTPRWKLSLEKGLDQTYTLDFDGIVKAHQFWYGKMSQFALLKGQLREEYENATGEMKLHAQNILLHQKLDENQAKTIIKIITHWKTIIAQYKLQPTIS